MTQGEKEFGSSQKEAEELTHLILKEKPHEKGTISKAELAHAEPLDKVKAVLFIPEGASIKDDLEIEVVGLSAATLGAMVARRC